MPQPMVNRLFTQIAQDMASEHRTEIESLSTEERLGLVKKILTQEGFNVEVERHGDFYHIRELNCPYYHLGQTHPEVCSIDQTLISTVLNIPAHKIQCILQGDSHCTFVISNENTSMSNNVIHQNQES
jgi:predicted ArsR family transcriptional regulator